MPGLRPWGDAFRYRQPPNRKLQHTLVCLRVIGQVCPAVFCFFAAVDHRNLDHPVTIIQLAQGMAHCVLGAKRPETLDFADRNCGGAIIACMLMLLLKIVPILTQCAVVGNRNMLLLAMAARQALSCYARIQIGMICVGPILVYLSVSSSRKCNGYFIQCTQAYGSDYQR